MELPMRNFERALFKTVSCVVLFALLTASIVFAGWTSADAGANPLTGNPLSFDEMLPYLSKGQPVYRSGTGNKEDNHLERVGDSSDKQEDRTPLKDETMMEGMFGD